MKPARCLFDVVRIGLPQLFIAISIYHKYDALQYAHSEFSVRKSHFTQ